MKKYLLSFAFILLSIASFGQKQTKIVGTWLTQDGDSKVEITQNEDGGFTGQIIWLKNPIEEDGTEKLDKHNPDSELKTRKIKGLEMLKNFKYDEDEAEWSDGTIYDPKSGNTYKCYMWFDGNPNKLNVKGYIGFSLIGKKVNWTRVLGDV
ncbi:DUF2147 domain-containing protein [Carboxylicivirga sp. M1479]|uniref:DUF2147 domain-containing protein n=1 Tax=Carboxylicivirga sp. M1479 TaxID=2594476 RepID=UPI001177DFDF|nr:DUF2147 domain-containing protein [Carboxylicivirga sp. M1479]TRX72435.1 DUF2147 domain-containing protein [Carboxylicivirga sp. M1479]